MNNSNFCQYCNKDVRVINVDPQQIILYHKDCWVEFQQEMIAVARGEHKYEL